MAKVTVSNYSLLKKLVFSQCEKPFVCCYADLGKNHDIIYILDITIAKKTIRFTILSIYENIFIT